MAEALRPGSVALRGHSYANPLRGLESAAGAGAITVHDAPSAFSTPEVGDKLARLRLEQEDVARRLAHGDGTCAALRPGYVFGLAESGREALNRDWLVTSAEHHATVPAPGADAPASYRNRFAAIPSDVPFRTPGRRRRARWCGASRRP